MKVTYSGLKDFLDLKISPAALAQKLTLAGLEVVSLEAAGGDYIFEIEITSNRPDWLSVLGIAREVSAICGLKLKKFNPRELKLKAKDLLGLKISIADKKDCSFYSGRIISEVRVGPSPDWLRKRVESLGCRSVNNIVDITNYVLFQTGQPLHAFDLDTLKEPEIKVRRAKADEKIVTLDGQQKILTPEILVIADPDKPVAIAGIMGGQETEVSFKTRNILLESAVFNPLRVRRGKQILGLHSEAAYRFERGVDLKTAQTAALAAQELILKFAGGKLRASKHVGLLKSANSRINLEVSSLNKVLGTAIPALKIKQILSRLGLQVKSKTKDILMVKVPSFRQDLKAPIDLVEEVARIHGYAKIAPTLPALRPGERFIDSGEIASRIKNILSSLGLHEVITYSLVDRNLLVKSELTPGVKLVEILNPLSREQEVLRPTILPSLIRCLAYNLNQQQEYVNIFEIANIFSGTAICAQEELSLGLALCGVNSFLASQGLVRDEVTLLHLKGILESLFSKLGVKSFDFIRQNDYKINIMLGAQEAGFIWELSPQVLSAFDIKNRQVILAQINLGKLLSQINLNKKFQGIPKYPGITRDISFLMKKDILVKDLLVAIQEKCQPLLSQARVVDYYQGQQVPEGFKGLTISCVYRLAERTLTEEEINPLHNAACSLLKERFDLKLR